VRTIAYLLTHEIMTESTRIQTSHFVHVNKIQMHYAAAGVGPTVVLLHGFPETHRSWDLQVPALVEAGFRVITPDLRGYGSTDRPRRGYELENLGRDIAELIDVVTAEAQSPQSSTDQAVFLVGHDWGGAVAWQVATRYPEKLRRLIVLNCPHPVRMAEALVSDRDQLARSWYMFFFQLPLLPEWWLTKKDGANLTRLFRANFSRPHTPPPDILEASRQALMEPGAAGAAIAYYRFALRSWFHPLRWKKNLQSYGPIGVPVSVIWGERDIALGKSLLEGSERFAPDLEVLPVPNAGHFVHQEQPDIVNARLLEVLRR